MEHTADLAQGIPGNYVFEVLQSSGSYLAGWFRETLGDPKLLGAPDPALDEALEGADTVIVSVASVGVEQVANNGSARHRQSRCTHGDLQGIP